jgi:hypothetical protein
MHGRDDEIELVKELTMTDCLTLRTRDLSTPPITRRLQSYQNRNVCNVLIEDETF